MLFDVLGRCSSFAKIVCWMFETLSANEVVKLFTSVCSSAVEVMTSLGCDECSRDCCLPQLACVA